MYWCSESLVSVHWADRAKDHMMVSCSSADCTVACSDRDEIRVSISTGILERLSASVFSLPGQYLIVIRQLCNPLTSSGIKFSCGQHISEWVVICVYSARGADQIISSPSQPISEPETPVFLNESDSSSQTL